MRLHDKKLYTQHFISKQLVVFKVIMSKREQTIYGYFTPTAKKKKNEEVEEVEEVGSSKSVINLIRMISARGGGYSLIWAI